VISPSSSTNSLLAQLTSTLRLEAVLHVPRLLSQRQFKVPVILARVLHSNPTLPRALDMRWMSMVLYVARLKIVLSSTATPASTSRAEAMASFTTSTADDVEPASYRNVELADYGIAGYGSDWEALQSGHHHHTSPMCSKRTNAVAPLLNGTSRWTVLTTPATAALPSKVLSPWRVTMTTTTGLKKSSGVSSLRPQDTSLVALHHRKRDSSQ